MKGREGTLYFQIIHRRCPRQFATNYRLHPSEWDNKRSMIILDDNGDRRALLYSLRESVRYDAERLNRIIRRLEREGDSFSSDDVIFEFFLYRDEYSFFNHMERLISLFKEKGRTRTMETYRVTLNAFMKFRNNKDILLDGIRTETMESFEAWLRRREIKNNTVSFYMRILRAAYNRAVDDNVIEDRKPFRRVYTGIDKTVKRALPLDSIRRIKELDLTGDPSLDYARDIFMLSFLLRGMSIVDMAFLQKSDLCNGYLSYRRRKTGRKLTVKWTSEMQDILDKYPRLSNPYLLPIIKSKSTDERKSYLNEASKINRRLKTIGRMAGISSPLTLYVARHSWASVAKASGIPLAVISEGMGHDSESTTRIYLSNIDTSAIDNANSVIIGRLKTSPSLLPTDRGVV